MKTSTSTILAMLIVFFSLTFNNVVGDNRTVLVNYAKDVYGFRTQFTKGPVFESSYQPEALEALVRMAEDYNKGQ